MRDLREPRALLSLLLLVLAAACGSAAVTHRFEISIADPAGRLGPPPFEVSVFDWQMGRSEEWARKTVGVAAPGAPMRASYGDVVTKTLFDASPPRRVSAALWVPAYEKAGFFAFEIEPAAGVETTVTLPFVPWGDPGPGVVTVPPLTARVLATDGGEGAWHLRLTLDLR